MNASNSNQNTNPSATRRPNGSSDPVTSQGPKASRLPTHIVYQVRELPNRQDKKAVWIRIGSAWPHRDGQGFNVQVDAVPLDGRIVLRVADDKRD